MQKGNGQLFERVEKQISGGKNIAYQFSDTLDFKNYLELGGSNHTQRLSRDVADSWNGGESFETNMGRVTEGWDQHRSEVNQNAGQITADAYRETESMRPAARIDFFGGAVDIGRFVTGDPENMVDFQLAPSNGHDKVCTLLVGVSANSGQRADHMVKRGAAIVALIDILAGTGRSVEVWVEATSFKGIDFSTLKGKGNSVSTLVCVKQANGPLDLDQLLYMVAHPGAFRKTMFAAWEGMGGKDARHMSDTLNGSLYGYPSNALLHGETVEATVELENMGQRKLVAEVKNPVGWIVEVLDAVCG